MAAGGEGGDRGPEGLKVVLQMCQKEACCFFNKGFMLEDAVELLSPVKKERGVA